jgi:hypothetical protein
MQGSDETGGPRMSTSTAPFSAADPALGYLYQIRLGLLWALRRLKASQDFLISIETLDDVTFETSGGAPNELLQTKHHLNAAANLSDASPDLWKTLRVWFDAAAGGLVTGAALHLVTTASAAPGSIAAHLRSVDRNVDAALSAMATTAQSSTNATNAAGYKAFLGAAASVRRALVESIVVFDGFPTITALDADLRTEVFWAALRKDHHAFLERLEGWWFRRTLKQLAAIAAEDRITATEIEAQMSDLREQFKQDALPIDEDLLTFDLDEATKAAHVGSAFVRQLELITAGKRRIAAAIRDYYRAFEQRSRWLRNDLLHVGDVTGYESRLVQEWELIFEAMKDDLGADAAEDARHKAARDVLKWAERTLIPIRPSVTEPFVTRGSLHMLADEVRIGWHPDFRDRLAEILSAKEADT